MAVNEIKACFEEVSNDKSLGKYWTFIELDAETEPEHEQTIIKLTLKEATE